MKPQHGWGQLCFRCGINSVWGKNSQRTDAKVMFFPPLLRIWCEIMEVRALSVSHWCWGRGITLIFTLTQHYSIIAQALFSHSPATCALGFPGKLEQPAAHILIFCVCQYCYFRSVQNKIFFFFLHLFCLLALIATTTRLLWVVAWELLCSY